MTSPQLSLCMVVRDEELLIAQAITSVRDVVDDIVVIDRSSTPRTGAIARNLGARVFDRPVKEHMGRARNASLDEARGDWVLVLDGDERIAARDVRNLRALTENPDAAGYSLIVHNYTRTLDLLCDWHPNRGLYPEEEAFSQCPGYSRFRVVRLFRRAPGVRYQEGYSTHANPVKSLRATGGAIHDTDIALHHFQLLKGGESFVAGKQVSRLEQERKHLELCPDDALAHLNVGRTLFALGKDDDALHHLDRAVEIGDEKTPALLSRGVVRFETGDYEGARADLEATVRSAPALGDPWIVLGIVRHAMGHFGEAEANLQRALELRPEHPMALNSLGVLQMDLGNVTKAEGLFRRALSVLPEHPMARDNLRALLGDHRAPSTGADEESHRTELGDKGHDI